ncbi:M23 family metallopeptidase [Erythrobacter sp. W53]|uniref:M23 family metallopeptidase n=1 Tax=Erythrobacter sp. W53 TaxID=3425947 RepID=UPI003D7689CF
MTACVPAAAEPEVAADTASVSPPPAIRTIAVPPAPAPPKPEPTGPADFVYSGELTQGGWIKGQVPFGTRNAFLNDTPLELDSSDKFFGAFDRDAGGEAVLRAEMEDGSVKTKTLTITRREWNIQRVNVAKRPSGSSESWWKRREPEWLAIKAAREKLTGATGFSQDFIWPVKGRISGHFGRQRIYRGGEAGSYHSGIDIAPGHGVPFVAPADGVVVLARTGFSLEGGLIIIDHGGGLNSAFLHASKLMVEEGDQVRQGEHIGNVGSTGRSTGPHLHWGLKWREARLDPLLFVGPM